MAITFAEMSDVDNVAATANTNAQNIASLEQRIAALEALHQPSPTVIFQDDFSTSANWAATVFGVPQMWGAGNPIPGGWDGYRCESNGDLRVLAGAGENGSNALRIGYRVGASQAGALTLYKHLTGGDASTGYPEIYVRMRMRYADDWLFGNGTNQVIHKWFRAWQNIGYGEPNMSETAHDTGYVIATQHSSKTANVMHYFHSLTCNYQSDPGHSVNGPSISYDYYPYQAGSNQGFVDNTVGPVNTSNGSIPSPQLWHTYEWRLRLSEIGQADGIYELWVDGVKQIAPTRIRTNYGALEDGAGLTTEKRSGGFNLFLLFDNIQGAANYWPDQKYLYVDNVVISEQPIGLGYQV